MITIIKKVVRRLERLIKRNPQKHLRIDVECDSFWYGNEYGGFYLNPDLLDESSIIYSFGIGEDISFDEAIISKHGSKVIGFDPTPKSINWLNSRALPDNYTYYEYGLSNKSGQVDFYLPQNKDYVSGSVHLQKAVDANRKVSVQMKTLGEIVKELGHAKIDVLKMDIEGSEYDVVDDLLNIPIDQVLVEFHDRFFDEGTKKSKNFVKKMKAKDYHIFAVSDSKEEVSFIHKNALTKAKKSKKVS